MLTELYLEKGWIKQTEENERMYYITPKGKKSFTDMGVDLSLIPEETSIGCVERKRAES